MMRIPGSRKATGNDRPRRNIVGRGNCEPPPPQRAASGVADPGEGGQRGVGRRRRRRGEKRWRPWWVGQRFEPQWFGRGTAADG